MLFELLLNYVDNFTFLNVFKYITFRTGLAFFTSLSIALIIGGPFIKLFSTKKIFNPIREDGPSDHIIKKIGTPTMGGVIILMGLIISVLLWADLTNVYIHFLNNISLESGFYNAGFENLSVMDIAKMVSKKITSDLIVTKLITLNNEFKKLFKIIVRSDDWYNRV